MTPRVKLAVDDTCRCLQFFLLTGAFAGKQHLRPPHRRVYSEHYSAYAGCASARPPGADTRRPPPPPPLAGVVPFSGQVSRNLVNSARLALVAERRFLAIPAPRSSHRSPSSTVAGRRGAASPSARRVGSMTTSNGVLALVGDAALRDDVDRVAAAAGVPVVHASGAVEPQGMGRRRSRVARRRRAPGAAPSARCPAAAGFVLVGPNRAPGRRLPSRDRGWRAAHHHAARSRTASSSPCCPTPRMRRARATAGRRRRGHRGPRRRGRLACSRLPWRHGATDALLVDVDPWGGGIDLVLGSEDEPGLRWPDLALQGGRLSTAVREALPRTAGSACCRAAAPDATSTPRR